jgi:hypothetical protein
LLLSRPVATNSRNTANIPESSADNPNVRSSYDSSRQRHKYRSFTERRS